MSFTFDQLKTAIQDYTQNTETSFVTNLPVFIRIAEERILKNVQLTLFRKNATANATNGDKFLAAPSDFLAPFSLSFTDSSSNQVFLDYKDVNFVQEFNPNSATTGDPRYYALFDDSNFILGPTPNSNYAVELHYFYRPTSLTSGSGSGTTWLSENAEVTLLYGSLVEAYTYMKGEPDVMQEYEKRFAESIISMKNFGESKEVTDAYRTGLVIRDKT
jgi:hypothetical protein|tara:strand:- start:1707 stop:2357 length:651 start_codon:yes stop_codon:yes gene_type:complete